MDCRRRYHRPLRRRAHGHSQRVRTPPAARATPRRPAALPCGRPAHGLALRLRARVHGLQRAALRHGRREPRYRLRDVLARVAHGYGALPRCAPAAALQPRAAPSDAAYTARCHRQRTACRSRRVRGQRRVQTTDRRVRTIRYLKRIT